MALAGSNYYYRPHGAEKAVGTDSTEIPKIDCYAVDPGAPGFAPSMTPFHFRMTSSARFNAIANPSKPGHSCNVDAIERRPASNTAFESGWKRPPANCATWRNSDSLAP